MFEESARQPEKKDGEERFEERLTKLVKQRSDGKKEQTDNG